VGFGDTGLGRGGGGLVIVVDSEDVLVEAGEMLLLLILASFSVNSFVTLSCVSVLLIIEGTEGARLNISLGRTVSSSLLRAEVTTAVVDRRGSGGTAAGALIVGLANGGGGGLRAFASSYCLLLNVLGGGTRS